MWKLRSVTVQKLILTNGQNNMEEHPKDKLRKIQDKFLKSLPLKTAELSQLWYTINLHHNKKGFQKLHQAVHSLCGATGTYGFTALYESFRDLDVYLKQLTDYNELTATHRSEISHLIERIKDTVAAKQKKLRSSLESYQNLISSQLIIYLIDHKNPFKNNLQKALQHEGYDLKLIKTIKEFQNLTKDQLPAAIIVDQTYLDHDNLKKITSLRQQFEIPFLCMATDSQILTRLKAIRTGFSGFFEQSMDIPEITIRLVELCNIGSKDNYRILILDDSETLVEYYALILREAGLNVATITDPMMLLYALQDYNPNLLLMDLYLPGCTGFELATMVRQEEFYMSLPIIFISTENDRYKQLAILNGCGGDDFLTKPVLPQNLVAAVKSRAQRSALLNAHLIHDPLTQLLTHACILKQLRLELSKAKQGKQNLIVAMIDLDNFKSINDKFGHPTGDVVLKKIAMLLSENLRQNDFIGRYGGEEFIIIFPNTSLNNALKICNEIREIISAHLFEFKGENVYVTLSAGIADFPTYTGVDSIINAADRALYNAKLDGRNKVC